MGNPPLGDDHWNYNESKGGNNSSDAGINLIKTNLPTFKSESDPKVYLTMEFIYEKIFQVNDLTNVKKSCYTILQ